MAKPLTVIVKFSQKCSPAEQQSFLRALVGEDFREAEPLFPDVEDIELATLIEVRLRENARVEHVLERLMQSDRVEYAHLPEDRKQI